MKEREKLQKIYKYLEFETKIRPIDLGYLVVVFLMGFTLSVTFSATIFVALVVSTLLTLLASFGLVECLYFYMSVFYWKREYYLNAYSVIYEQE